MDAAFVSGGGAGASSQGPHGFMVVDTEESRPCVATVQFNKETLALYKANESRAAVEKTSIAIGGIRESENVVEIIKDVAHAGSDAEDKTVSNEEDGELNGMFSPSEGMNNAHRPSTVEEGKNNMTESVTVTDDSLFSDDSPKVPDPVDGRDSTPSSSQQPVTIKSEPDEEAQPCFSSVAPHEPHQSSKLVYRCKYCGQQLMKMASLQRHEEAHRNGTIYKCRFCEYYAMERSRIAAHECKHTGEKPFACDRCEFRCASSCDLSKHNLVHAVYRPYQCELCTYSAKTASNLHKHMRVHSDRRPFACGLCEQKFKTKSACDNHRMLHSDSAQYFCDKCNYSCKTRNLLRQHAISHSEVRNFACSHPGCSQRCKTKSDLVKHMSVHKTGLDYKCVLCNKLFKSRHSLRSHTRRHEKREYPCHVCGKVLLSSNSLRHHMLALHLEGKKIGCLICGNKFGSRENLKAHIKVHETDRAFRCPLCLQGFLTMNHLFTHIGAFHGKDYVYVCEICNRPFSRYMMMKFHIDRNHVEDKDKPFVHEFVYNQNCSSCDVDELERKLHEMKQWIYKNTKSKSLNSEDVKPDLEMDIDRSSDACESALSQNLPATPSLTNGVSATKNLGPQDCHPSNSSTHASQSNGTEKSTRADALHHGKQDHSVSDLNIASFSLIPQGNVGLGNKTLEIKLERVDDNILLPGGLTAETEPHNINPKSVENFSKVIKLGSYASVSINLAGKESGLKFNMKKGKKCKGWFSHPDNMMPEAREKTINYLVKQASFTQRKVAGKQMTRKRRKPAKESSHSIVVDLRKGCFKSKDKGKRKKEASSTPKASVHRKGRKKKGLSASVHSDPSSGMAVAIKTEIQDMAYTLAEQNQYHPMHDLQERNSFCNETQRHSRDPINTDNTNSSVLPGSETKLEQDDNHMENPNATETPLGTEAPVLMGKKNSIKVSGPKKKKNGKFASGRNQRKVVKSQLSDDTNNPSKRKGKKLPVLVIPKLNKLATNMNTAKGVNEQSPKSKEPLDDPPQHVEPSAVLEVEDVVDSPVRVTWKKVGGHKDNRTFRKYMMQHCQSLASELLPSTSKCILDKEGKTAKVSSIKDPPDSTNMKDHEMMESGPGANATYVSAKNYNATDTRVWKECIDSTKERSMSVPFPTLPESSSSRSEKNESFSNASSSSSSSVDETYSAVPGTASADTLTSTASSNVKVMSLEEFENEYRKKPRVVANVSLDLTRMKPVVELTDVCKKRKACMMKGNHTKIRLTTQMQTDSVMSENNAVLYTGTETHNVHHDHPITTQTQADGIALISLKEPLAKPKRKYTVDEMHSMSKVSGGIEFESNSDFVWDSNLTLNNLDSVTSQPMESCEEELDSVDFDSERIDIVIGPEGNSRVHRKDQKAKGKPKNAPLGKASFLKSSNDEGLAKQARTAKKSDKERGSKTMGKKTANRNKIKTSALFGKILERKKSCPVDVGDVGGMDFSTQNPQNLSNGSLEDTSGHSQTPQTFLSKQKKGKKQDGLKMRFKLWSQKSPTEKEDKNHPQTCVSNSNAAFKECKKKKRTGDDSLKVDNKIKSKPCKRKEKDHATNAPVLFGEKTNFSAAIENRIKLPGLMSIDTTERRLTVECVTTLPKVVLTKAKIGKPGCNLSSDSTSTPASESNGDGLVKIETDGDMVGGGGDTNAMFLSFALYQNCVGSSSRGSGILSEQGKFIVSDSVIGDSEPSHCSNATEPSDISNNTESDFCSKVKESFYSSFSYHVDPSHGSSTTQLIHCPNSVEPNDCSDNKEELPEFSNGTEPNQCSNNKVELTTESSNVSELNSCSNITVQNDCSDNKEELPECSNGTESNHCSDNKEELTDGSNVSELIHCSNSAAQNDSSNNKEELAECSNISESLHCSNDTTEPSLCSTTNNAESSVHCSSSNITTTTTTTTGSHPSCSELEDVLKKEEVQETDAAIPTTTTTTTPSAVIHNSPGAICDTSVMGEGYSTNPTEDKDIVLVNAPVLLRGDDDDDDDKDETNTIMNARRRNEDKSMAVHHISISISTSNSNSNSNTNTISISPSAISCDTSVMGGDYSRCEDPGTGL